MHVQHVMLHSFSFVTSEITFITGKGFNSMLLHHVKPKIGRLSRLVVAEVTRKFYVQVNCIHMCLQLGFLFPRKFAPIN